MRLRALDRKLLRESWNLRTQMLSIALVVASGIMTVVTMRGTYESLAAALDRYYRDYHFADVFASLERAPQGLADRIGEINGVAAVETRVSFTATLDVPGLPEPGVGMMLSLPDPGRTALNEIHLVLGRRVELGRVDEVLISESFATSNALKPGSSIDAVINGRRRTLQIVGIAISPDHIGEVAAGSPIPDDRRFAVIRMNRDALAALADMEGAFNEVALRLSPGAGEARVIDEVDQLLMPYGGDGAYGRSRHPSHQAVTNELEQNRVTGTLIPGIFLGVATFLLSIVLGRLIGTQRNEIAVLKAFGYTNTAIGAHYLCFALIPVLLGSVIGVGMGIWLGGGLINLYGDFFRFPELEFSASWKLILLAVAISILAAGAGALGAVRKAVRLQPAEAMRPEAPGRFEPGPLERLGLGRWLPVSARLILRNVERQPFRSFASTMGIALSTMMIAGTLVIVDSTRYMAELQFEKVQREDLALDFVVPLPHSVVNELRELDGVLNVEVVRAVPARFRHLHRERTTILTGLDPSVAMRRIVDRNGNPHGIPSTGMTISAAFADVLDVGVGDTITVGILQGSRRELEIPVAATSDEMFGLTAYMDYTALHAALGEAPAVSGAYLRVQDDQIDALNDRFKSLRAVLSVYSPDVQRENFEQQLSEGLYISVGFLLALASILAICVIYNGARIALSERGRELASLRVLGFTRREVGVLLLGEQGVLTTVAIPLGWLMGIGLITFVLRAMASELYRFPLVVTNSTFLIAASATALAAALAGLAVRRRLDRLDLIEVLKTRE